MSEELKELLDDTAGEEIPLGSFDTKAAVVRGRAALVRRRLAVGGLTTGVVAVIAAAMVVLPGMSARPEGPGVNAAASGSASASVPETEQGLPELDPDEVYEWVGNQATIGGEDKPTHNETTDAYTKAYQDYLNATFGGFDPEVMTGFGRYDSMLIRRDDPSKLDVYTTLRTQPQYTLYMGSNSFTDPKKDGPLIVGAKDGSSRDTIRIDVWAPGGFTTGTNGPAESNMEFKGGDGAYDLVRCSDYSSSPDPNKGVPHTVTCTEDTTKFGERIVNMTDTEPADGGNTTVRHTTVLYRADGSAVVLYNEGYPNQNRASYSHEMLKDIATSLPVLPVV